MVTNDRNDHKYDDPRGYITSLKPFFDNDDDYELPLEEPDSL